MYAQNKRVYHEWFCGYTLGILAFVYPLWSAKARAEDMFILVGSDIPYQDSVCSSLWIEDFDLSVRTGVLVSPYSDATLSLVVFLGTEDIYISAFGSSVSVWLDEQHRGRVCCWGR
jgi:hypothetical protein